jgi:type IV pilus assembly protein PilX
MHHPSRPLRPQQGLSLIFSLLTLVALSLSALALIRSVDTGTLVLGNLGFKQDTQLAADDAARSAMAWLSDNVGKGTLNADRVTDGYYAKADPNLDPTGNNAARTLKVGWDTNSCAVTTTRLCPSAELQLSNDVKAKYLIQRLCNAAGDPYASGSTIACARPLSSSTVTTGNVGNLSYTNPTFNSTTTFTQYYRILVRATGPRNTTTFTESIVHY